MLFPSLRLEITVPKVNNDLLIKLPSLRDWPDVPDLLARSDPARSTKLRVHAAVGLSLPQDVLKATDGLYPS